MKEIELGGATYQVGALDAMKQFHVSRRVAPIQVAMGVTISEMLAGGAADDAAMVGAMGRVTEILAKMSDEETEYVLHTCLGVVKRRDGDRWATLWVAGRLMYPITMQEMVRLSIEVMKENLGDFFGGPLGGAL